MHYRLLIVIVYMDFLELIVPWNVLEVIKMNAMVMVYPTVCCIVYSIRFVTLMDQQLNVYAFQDSLGLLVTKVCTFQFWKEISLEKKLFIFLTFLACPGQPVCSNNGSCKYNTQKMETICVSTVQNGRLI